MGWMGWDGRLSPSASLLRAPYGANKGGTAPTGFFLFKIQATPKLALLPADPTPP